MNSMLRPFLVLLLAAMIVTAAVVIYQDPDLLPWPVPPAGEPSRQAQPDAPARVETAAPPPAGERDHKLRLGYLQKLLAGVDREQREQLLEDEAAFRQFVRQEADNQSILAAARANEVHQNETVAFLMRRGADSVLREAYLDRLMQEQLRPDFPTRDEVRAFYERNLERFRIGERIQVWQVFLPVKPGAGEDAAVEIEKQARDIRDRLRNGKIDFADAALRHSAHEPSRQNGGFMGAVQVADLKSDIARVLGGMETGAIALARSDDGWHVLRKGDVIPPEQLEFEQVEDRVRQLLVNQARQEFRDAVYQKVRETYPQDDLSEQRIEQWRLELRTETKADWAR